MKARSYLCYTRKTRPTAKVVAALLDIDRGIRQPMEGNDVLVRWGSRKPMPRARIEVNNPRAMALASDKILAFHKMAEAGLPVPRWETTFDALVERHRGIILGRSRSGMKGKDIVVYDPYRMYADRYPRRPVQYHDFYSAYIEPIREVRIHVVNGQAIRVQAKYLDEPDKAQDNPFVRNYDHGYRFRAPRRELLPARKQKAIAAVEALGLTFGAVDMLITGRDAQYILEVNTAPACSPLTARCYAAAIALYVQQASGGDIVLAPSLLETEMEAEDDDYYER